MTLRLPLPENKHATTVSVYAPTMTYPDEAKGRLYYDLEYIISATPRTEKLIFFGLRYVSWYKCLIVSLVFSHLGFWSGNLFLVAPFPDLCLLVLFNARALKTIYDPKSSLLTDKEVQVGNDQEMAQSDIEFYSKKRGGKN